MITKNGTCFKIKIPSTLSKLQQIACLKFGISKAVVKLSDDTKLDQALYQQILKDTPNKTIFKIECKQQQQNEFSVLNESVNSKLYIDMINKQTQTDFQSISQFQVIPKQEINTGRILRHAIQLVMQSLKYQVDLKWVNLTINNIKCKKCRKYPIIGRVLQGPQREALCQPCFAAVNSSFKAPSLGQGLYNFLFKKKVQYQQQKRAYIQVMKNLVGTKIQKRLEVIMQQNPKLTVKQFIELAVQL